MPENSPAEHKALFGCTPFMTEDDTKSAVAIANRPQKSGDRMPLAMPTAGSMASLPHPAESPKTDEISNRITAHPTLAAQIAHHGQDFRPYKAFLAKHPRIQGWRTGKPQG